MTRVVFFLSMVLALILGAGCQTKNTLPPGQGDTTPPNAVLSIVLKTRNNSKAETVVLEAGDAHRYHSFNLGNGRLAITASGRDAEGIKKVSLIRSAMVVCMAGGQEIVVAIPAEPLSGKPPWIPEHNQTKEQQAANAGTSLSIGLSFPIGTIGVSAVEPGVERAWGNYYCQSSILGLIDPNLNDDGRLVAAAVRTWVEAENFGSATPVKSADFIYCINPDRAKGDINGTYTFLQPCLENPNPTS